MHRINVQRPRHTLALPALHSERDKAEHNQSSAPSATSGSSAPESPTRPPARTGGIYGWF
jgi:hypothetical protein